MLQIVLQSQNWTKKCIWVDSVCQSKKANKGGGTPPQEPDS